MRFFESFNSRNVISRLGISLIYCRNCGKEISEKAKFCPYCGVSRATPPPEREKVVIQQKPSWNISSFAGVILMIIILLGGFLFVTTVEMFDCPQCNNSPLLRWFCSYCGGDGKVTLMQLVMHSVSHSIASLPQSSICSDVSISHQPARAVSRWDSSSL
ncbi:zinc ribbon domain-containing protein [Candidatus Bathyarchaeota archaeon]|nr:zinc ribbon domain-containing protein [Candidatus Bathyarchaeota archaeon]